MERSESIRPGAAGHHKASVDGGGRGPCWRLATPTEGEKESFLNASIQMYARIEKGMS